MRTETRQIVSPTTVTVYIANDGMVFDDAKSCLLHENEDEIRRKFHSLVSGHITTPDVFNVYDADIEVLTLRKPEDVQTVIDGCENERSYYMDSYVSESLDKMNITAFPAKIILFRNDSFVDVFSVENFVKQTTKALSTVINSENNAK